MKTLQECEDEIAKEYGHANWSAIKNRFSKGDPHDIIDLITFCDEANKRFYEQAVETQQGWIDVKTELPPVCEEVLVHKKGYTVLIYFSKGHDKQPLSHFIEAGITHWMRKPEPPTKTN